MTSPYQHARRIRRGGLGSCLAAILLLGGLGVLAGCGSTPPTPDWQMEAHGALERAQRAYLVGDGRVEAVEYERARTQLASTGRPELVARAVLARCAWRVASLDFDRCAGFEALAEDAAPAERAYARYLEGQAGAADAALLPPQHRAFAGPGAAPAAVAAIEDPTARLVAAGVLLRSGRADPAVVATAVDTASAQGWRRPLLAWLGVALRGAQQAGDAEAAARLQRRIALAGATSAAGKP